MQDILDLGIEELKDALRDMGEKPFRAGQIYSWLNEKLVFDFEDMTNLSKPLREKLKKNFRIGPVTMVARQISQIDKTEKFLFRLHDGHMVETVLMRYKHGNSVCISSQVGCRMGCRFCASTIDGWIRNLTPGEMLGQIYKVQQISGERVSNIVVMGTGEPLDNYDNLLAFIHRISDEKGLNISQRNITVSTCGLVPAIYALADENLAITLALSLHGATQEKREALMPIAKKYTLDEVMGACRHYFKKTGRRMSYEYALLDGVSMPYGPFFGDTDFPLRAARPSSGEQPGALRSRAGTWNETGRKPFSFFTLNTAASGVHTKRETSSSPESRKLNKLTAWGPPQEVKVESLVQPCPVQLHGKGLRAAQEHMSIGGVHQ